MQTATTSTLLAAGAISCLLALATAQQDRPATPAEPPPTARLTEQIRSDGWFEPSRWRRDDDGALAMHYFADLGGEIDHDRFVPLLGKNLEQGWQHAGAFGLVSLFCHGPGDLLGMTDAGFHLGALGIGTSNMALRQYLAVAPAHYDGPRGRAEAMDRMVAIDALLRARGRGAIPELRAILQQQAAPPALRARASRAIALLQGEADPLARKRLDAAQLRLPLTFDAIVVIDHTLLPDLSWLPPLGRRLGALVTAKYVDLANGELTPAMGNAAQRMCNLCSELPFEAARVYGNARVDHSVLVVSPPGDERLPVSLSWQGVGEFEIDRWQLAAVDETLAREHPLLGGSLEVAAERFVATTHRSAGIPRPSLVEKLDLLRATGAAIRAIVPGNSQLWTAAAFLRMPPAVSAEVRVVFGAVGSIQLDVTARDEDAAAMWVEFAESLRAQIGDFFELAADELQQSSELRALVASLSAAKVVANGNVVTATVQCKAPTREELERLLTLLLLE